MQQSVVDDIERLSAACLLQQTIAGWSKKAQFSAKHDLLYYRSKFRLRQEYFTTHHYPISTVCDP
jgi:hypothetical protein